MRAPYRKALTALISEIEQRSRSATAQLPDLHTLARNAGVAHQTMRKALKAMEAAGAVSVLNRKGAFILPTGGNGAPVTPVADTGEATVTIVHTLTERIAAEIGSAVFARGHALPGYKELGKRYGAGYRSLRKALLDLANRGIVERYGRAFRPVASTPEPSYGRIIFVAVTDAMHVLMNFTPRTPEFWRLLDTRCGRDNIRIEVYGYLKAVGEFPWHDGRTEDLTRRDRDQPVLGYILWTLGMQSESAVRLIHLIASTGRPLAVMHDNPGIDLSLLARTARSHPHVQVWHFSVSPLCGRILGGYLAGLGHRRASFFYFSGSDPLWQSRIDGVKAAYRDRKLDFSYTRLYPAGKHGKNDSTAFRHASYSSRAADKITSILDHARKDIRAQYDETLPDINAMFLLDRMLEQNTMIEPFTRALEDRRCTAWIGLSDPAAILALSFLRRQGVAVPGEISVAGFDDSIEAIGNGVTSYNFNMPALVEAMIDHLYNPSSSGWAGRIQEIPGRVMHRFSCGNAPAEDCP
jgi:DNA-binding FadR family transcriptional regulator/DNA-binding LacI/PurR family transcriptional regulator